MNSSLRPKRLLRSGRPKRKKDSSVAERGLRARQRILKNLASLNIQQLRTVPRQTIAALTWLDLVEMIAIRHQMRSIKKHTMQYKMSRVGYHIDVVIHQTRNLMITIQSYPYLQIKHSRKRQRRKR